ncbi:TPA: histidine kinase, partial [Candidatus Micrarchaeota archaeon]|nr:histidine kinase [Candidatus Micrarchaeota archaeon]
MVEDLSMHVADLLENSLRAGARNIELLFERRRNELRLEVTDDGAGM